MLQVMFAPRFLSSSTLQRAREFGATFADAAPFRHVVIDSLVKDVATIESGFPAPAHADWKRKDHPEQRARLGGLQRSGFRAASDDVRAFLGELCGPAFIGFVEKVTGERGLIADPHFHGAGLHMTLPGGGLGVHTDFSRDRGRDLHRACTALFYLNEEWSEEWGGALELWSENEREKEIAMRPGRCVILENVPSGFHGQPRPLSCPDDATRKVISACFYVADRQQRSTPSRAVWHSVAGRVSV